MSRNKSLIGLSPIAKEPPPIAPGKPWWTTPPIALPQPEHIEYVAQYRAELVARKRPGKADAEINAMLAYVNNWLTVARRLLHENVSTPGRRDLQTTDGILIAVCNVVSELCAELVKRGGEITPEQQQVIDAARGRASRIIRERAIERAKRGHVGALP